VLTWDLFNEPDNPNILSYIDVELPPQGKVPAAEALLRKAFDWARSVGPTQPLTVHDIFCANGTPYDPDEVSLIRSLTSAPR